MLGERSLVLLVIKLNRKTRRSGKLIMIRLDMDTMLTLEHDTA